MVRNITVMLLTNLLLQSIHLNGLGQKLCQLPKLSGCDMHKLVPFIDSLINDKVHCSPALRVFFYHCAVLQTLWYQHQLGNHIGQAKLWILHHAVSRVLLVV